MAYYADYKPLSGNLSSSCTNRGFSLALKAVPILLARNKPYDLLRALDDFGEELYRALDIFICSVVAEREARGAVHLLLSETHREECV